MKKILVAMNHVLTKDQVEDLKKMDVEEIIESKVWKNNELKKINPYWDMDYINELSNRLVNEIIEGKFDGVILLGEYSLILTTFMKVKTINEKIKFLVPTTERVVEEIKKDDGTIEKKSFFKHIKFRVI